MFRITSVALLFLLVWGCGGREMPLANAGPQAAYAAQQADSSAVTTRRVSAKADYWLSVSPDGGHIAFTDWFTADLVLQDLQTGAVKRITQNGVGMTPRISPDGRSIAFTWFGPKDNPQLRVANLDGSGARAIYEASMPVKAEDWSPDGQTILGIRDQEDGTKQIVLVPIKGGSVRSLKTLDWREPMRMNFSPDGRFIVYDFPTVEESSAHRDVFVLDLATNRESRLVEHPANDYVLGWGPDDRHVLFASDRTGTPGAWLQEVENGRRKGEPVLVKPELWSAMPGQFTANGSFYYGVQTGNRRLYVATVDSATGKIVGSATSLTPTHLERAADPQWTPDGRSLSYLVRNASANQTRLAIRSQETGEVREMPLPSRLSYPYHRWSPDGKSVILKASEKGRDGLFRMDPQTGRAEPLFLLDRGTRLGMESQAFQLTSDGGEAIYGKSYEQDGTTKLGGLVVRDLRTQRERPLYDGPARRLVLSPDGANLAFVQRGVLTVMPLQGGSARQIGPEVVNNGWTAWSANGRYLFVVRQGADPKDRLHNQVWRVPLDGGAPEPIGITGENVGDLRLDPSGRRLAYVSGTETSELWVMEHILSTAAKSARAGK